MIRSKILEALQKLDSMGLSRDTYALTYGAALVLHGIKEEASDIDIAAKPECIERLKALGYHAEPYNGDQNNLYFKITEYIDIFPEQSLARQRIGACKMIDGYNVQHQLAMIYELAARGREKDVKSVALINYWRTTHGYTFAIPFPNNSQLLRDDTSCSHSIIENGIRMSTLNFVFDNPNYSYQCDVCGELLTWEEVEPSIDDCDDNDEG